MPFIPSKPIPIPPSRANAHAEDLMLDCVDPGGVYIRPGRPGPSSTNRPPESQKSTILINAYRPPIPQVPRIVVTHAELPHKQPELSRLILERNTVIRAKDSQQPPLSHIQSRARASTSGRRSSSLGVRRPSVFSAKAKPQSKTTMKAGSSRGATHRSKLSVETTLLVTLNHEANTCAVSPPSTQAKRCDTTQSPTSTRVLSGSSSRFSALSLLQHESQFSRSSSPEVSNSKPSPKRQRVVIHGFEPKGLDHESWYLITRLKPPVLPPRPHYISIADLSRGSLRGWTPGSSETELIERWENEVEERWRDARWKAYRDSLVCPGSERCKRTGVVKAKVCRRVVLGNLDAGVPGSGLDAWRERCAMSKGLKPVLYPAIVEMRFGPGAWRPRMTTGKLLWNADSCAVFWDSVSNIRGFLGSLF